MKMLKPTDPWGAFIIAIGLFLLWEPDLPMRLIAVFHLLFGIMIFKYGSKFVPQDFRKLKLTDPRRLLWGVSQIFLGLFFLSIGVKDPISFIGITTLLCAALWLSGGALILMPYRSKEERAG